MKTVWIVSIHKKGKIIIDRAIFSRAKAESYFNELKIRLALDGIETSEIRHEEEYISFVSTPDDLVVEHRATKFKVH